jgi:hypothetical protein
MNNKEFKAIATIAQEWQFVAQMAEAPKRLAV